MRRSCSIISNSNFTLTLAATLLSAPVTAVTRSISRFWPVVSDGGIVIRLGMDGTSDLEVLYRASS